MGVKQINLQFPQFENIVIQIKASEFGYKSRALQRHVVLNFYI